MLNFKHLVLHNFCSYNHAELDLLEHGFCLVTGKNNCKADNATSNGAGKSVIWSALCFALTGETIQGLRTNLKNINVDEDSCYVSVNFEFNKDEYEVCRYIAPRSDLKIIKNSVDVSGKGIRESEKRLVELLPDLNKDLIASTIIIGQGLPNKFSSFSPSGRKELLEKLTQADYMIEDIKARVAQRQQDVATKIRELDDGLLVAKTKRHEAEKQLNTFEALINEISATNYDLEIAKASTACTRAEASMTSISGEVSKHEALVEGYNKRLLEITTQKNEDETNELAAYNSATSTVLTSRSYLAAEITGIESEITKLNNIKDVCPTCGQKIPGIIRPDTSKLLEGLTGKKEQLSELDAKLKAYSATHINYINMIKAAYATDISAVTKQLNETKGILTKLKIKLTELINTNKAAVEQCTKLNMLKQTATQNLKDATEKQKAFAECIKETDDNIKSLEASKLELLEHQAVLKKMDSLIRRDFRGFLLQNIIKYLDSRVKDFCEIVFGTRELSIYLDGNALDIAYHGKMFDNLSGGEKQRVDLILQFAIRDMLSVYLGLNANILVLDEITDFLDKKSCTTIMTLVSKELSSVESVFIVSHHAQELALPIDSEIEVTKDENGISYLK